MGDLKRIRILDNFYQSSAFFPTPVTLIATLTPDGRTNLGTYSLCYPYYMGGEQGYPAMVLWARNSSNTARNLLRNGKASICFIRADEKAINGCMALGHPGESTEEKMKDVTFHLIDSKMQDTPRPQIVKESFQVMECTWMRELDGAQDDAVQDHYDPPYHHFNGITSEGGAHFILRVDNLLLAEEACQAVVYGVTEENFPKDIPVSFGLRDRGQSFFAQAASPKAYHSPASKVLSLAYVKERARLADNEVAFSDTACEMLRMVPRIFLDQNLQGFVMAAKAENLSEIVPANLVKWMDKRREEKGE